MKSREIIAVLLVAAVVALILALTGCAAVEAVTDATREKTIAAGSDTWGGGMEAKTASADCPVPGFEGWFGRRRVWYVSVHDAKTGQAAAEVVRASNSAVTVKAAADGVTVAQEAAEE